MDVAAYLAAMDAALRDAHASIVLTLAGHEEETQARLWRGQVLVEWEQDDEAGDCLLRPALVQRLLALRAHVVAGEDELRVRAGGNVLAALSRHHTQLVAQLGGPARVEMRARLRFQERQYMGGEESYSVLDRGRAIEMLRLRVALSTRVAT